MNQITKLKYLKLYNDPSFDIVNIEEHSINKRLIKIYFKHPNLSIIYDTIIDTKIDKDKTINMIKALGVFWGSE
jgi:hypothetical protein